MSKKQKPLNYKDPEQPMNMEEAAVYLKKLGEWEGVWHLDRDTILKWAEFLRNKGETK
jgi:hypothetical protein